ncbi:MAG: glycosyltransferase family 4 protein [Xenococcaceae cyanobacterium]
MRVSIVRREPGVALSMDVYANNLIAGLKVLRPNWAIEEIAPEPWSKDANLWHSGTGLRKYYERFWRHPRAVRQQSADLFHIIDQSNAHVAYWLKKTDRPVVVTCHDMVHFVCPEILRDQCRFPAVSLASWKFSVGGMRATDRVMAVSEDTAKDITKMLGIDPDKIVAIPNGVDRLFRPLSSVEIESVRQRYKASAETICLLNVGSTHQRKNIMTVLQVLKILLDRGRSVRLWRVGDDFTIEQKAFIEAHNLEGAIEQIGKRSQAELLYIYNGADVLLAPSLYEGFGLTPLEAMACGTPTIGSNISAIPEVVGDAGILVDDPLNAPEIASLVIRLQDEPSYRNTLVTKGLERVKQYTWLRTAEEVARTYEQAIAARE